MQSDLMSIHMYFYVVWFYHTFITDVSIDTGTYNIYVLTAQKCVICVWTTLQMWKKMCMNSYLWILYVFSHIFKEFTHMKDNILLCSVWLFLQTRFEGLNNVKTICNYLTIIYDVIFILFAMEHKRHFLSLVLCCDWQ